MQVAKNTVEESKYTMMVPSRLDTLRMVVIALATTSTYGVIVCSLWGSTTRKMERDGIEAHITGQMALS